ncbi:MAG: hypothetical protein FWF73_07295 [Spirochaetes bacterium]|nr:hypothetical protein [Spirochaetota bacterium]
MKIIRITGFLILIFFMIQSSSFSMDTIDGEDLDINYSREFLIAVRDIFIEENGDLPIKKIKVEGISKTNRDIILKEAGVIEGDNLAAFDPHRFVNRLKKKNLFSEIKIYYTKEDDSVIINISLKEKMTLIPLPIFYSNGDKTMYGVYIVESNFLGYGKIFVGGVAFSADDKSITIGYMDPSICETRLAANIFCLYKDMVVENCTMDKFIFNEYKVKQKIFTADIGWSFTDEIKGFVSGGYIKCDVDKGYKDSLNPPQSENFYRYGIYLNYNSLEYYEYLFFGLKSIVRFYTYTSSKEKKDNKNNTYRVANYEIDYSHKLFSYHKITLFSSGSNGNRPTLIEDRLGGKNGSRTLTAGIIPSDNYINYSIIYEYPLAKFKYGAIAMLLLWEQGIYSNDDSKSNKYYGPGAGLLFYWKQIAFPAVGFNYAVNLKTDENELSANVNYRF